MGSLLSSDHCELDNGYEGLHGQLSAKGGGPQRDRHLLSFVVGRRAHAGVECAPAESHSAGVLEASWLQSRHMLSSPA